MSLVTQLSLVQLRLEQVDIFMLMRLSSLFLLLMRGPTAVAIAQYYFSHKDCIKISITRQQLNKVSQEY